MLLLLILLLVLIFGIIKNVNQKLNMQNYIITNYMYIFVSLLLYIIVNQTMENRGVSIMQIGERLLPLFILTLILLFGILFTPAKDQGLKHLLWLGFVILFSASGYPIYKVTKEANIMNKVLITLGILFIGLSYVAYTNRLGFFDSYYSYITIGLLGLIIFQSLDLLFADYQSSGIYTRFWYYSIFGIIIFSGAVIHSTQKMIKEGIVLENGCSNSHLVCADYPEKSLDMYLNIINLFNQISYVYKNK